MIEFVTRHPWRIAIILVVGIVLGTGAFYAYELNTAFGALTSEQFDPESARRAIEASAPVPVPSTVPDFEIEDPVFTDDQEMEIIAGTLGAGIDPRLQFPDAFGEPIPDEDFEAYLLVGTDASKFLADAIILALQPSDGGAPIMVSLPRDLYVWNLCRETFTRLNSGLGGCQGTASGSELMAIMVEDYTGIPIDHLARIDFQGFSRLVDAMGGITVCVDYPTRDEKALLDIPAAGCHRADGDMALAWVRSRQPEQLREDEWVRVSGSDFLRQRRQQDVLFQLAGRASNFSSPTSLASKLSAVASSVRLDSSWSFGEAVSAGWRYRGISRDSVKRFSIRVSDYRAPNGAAVLVPSTPFSERLSTVYELA